MNPRDTETRKGEGLSDLFAEVCADLLRRGYSVAFRAPGWSMHPTIRDGEMITAEPVAPDRVRWGEVVLYRVGAALLAHRVVGMRRGPGYPRFLVRGDAPGARDEGVTAGQILGRVVCAVRGGDTIRLSTPRARILGMVRHTGQRLKRCLAEGLLIFSGGLTD